MDSSHEPVLFVAGQVYPLNEDTVHKLTGGKLGLDGARGLVLDPARRFPPEVPPAVADLLREQAFRTFRTRRALRR